MLHISITMSKVLHKCKNRGHATSGAAASDYSSLFTGRAITQPHCGHPCFRNLSLCFSSSLSYFLSIWASSWWPGGLCGKSGPQWTTSEPIPKKPHQAVINGCISLSLLSLSLFIWNLIPLCAGDLVCVCCELGRGIQCVSEREGSHMLAVWTYSPN